MRPTPGTALPSRIRRRQPDCYGGRVVGQLRRRRCATRVVDLGGSAPDPQQPFQPDQDARFWAPAVAWRGRAGLLSTSPATIAVAGQLWPAPPVVVGLRSERLEEGVDELDPGSTLGITDDVELEANDLTSRSICCLPPCHSLPSASAPPRPSVKAFGRRDRRRPGAISSRDSPVAAFERTRETAPRPRM